MQSIQKEKEMLYAENEEKKRELERLQEENKTLLATLSKQGPPEGEKSDTKVLKINVFLKWRLYWFFFFKEWILAYKEPVKFSSM